jgi:hypothetical protein
MRMVEEQTARAEARRHLALEQRRKRRLEAMRRGFISDDAWVEPWRLREEDVRRIDSNRPFFRNILYGEQEPTRTQILTALSEENKDPAEIRKLLKRHVRDWSDTWFDTYYANLPETPVVDNDLGHRPPSELRSRIRREAPSREHSPGQGDDDVYETEASSEEDELNFQGDRPHTKSALRITYNQGGALRQSKHGSRRKTPKKAKQAKQAKQAKKYRHQRSAPRKRKSSKRKASRKRTPSVRRASGKTLGRK